MPHSMCHLPRPGIELSFPALAGGFLITGPLGKFLFPCILNAPLPISTSPSTFEHPQISLLNLLFMLLPSALLSPCSSFFLLINLLKSSLTLIPSTSQIPIHPAHCRPYSVPTETVITSFYFRLFSRSFSFVWLLPTPSYSYFLASPPPTGLLLRVPCFSSHITGLPWLSSSKTVVSYTM